MAFNLATSGCAMAHCDVRQSDKANAFALEILTSRIQKDVHPSGSNGGLGVVSNGNIIAATYAGLNPRLRIYDSNGVI